ncbi:MAG: bifunctional phosphopantothenoylcysteine decarboxylase/phosphopantothenate--cysteine ligase CoaBC [Chloroflexota bacterium]|jgi:phosphopantothenoylcysteine decarboxylase/phosphopantothenate--cysteine ligase|nr:bifunctional phosphopantothenoylcysteine decarboxylase/phosphopantothenate--cysteine ligase CoaBC [Chloroflexota bacterium]MDP6508247.1 bifunctional phosphopantothenoylcysteine decarboxylase/phosphopantothenate--cysteine ligase CoaBC [Chloroflexota bacterium]MDP6757094.1 bifunctional phosphopantothenoylcysteine decarboxylase/phosphopantothenate--cysteine ligase CoaBC [Chloroflexota bacterium]
MSGLAGKNIVLGVTGSIAAYKAVQLASTLSHRGAHVHTVMTAAARGFVSPLNFQALTRQAVHSDVGEVDREGRIAHVDRGRAADLMIVAPATANTIARLAMGLADDIVTATWLSTTAPRLVAPAMESSMYLAGSTQANLRTLADHGAGIIAPGTGRLASGHSGVGRLADVDAIIDRIGETLGLGGDLAGRQIVVTAGGTREAIDPVRFIGNPSSGRQGIALARAARDRGANVALIVGAIAVAPPTGMEVIEAASAAAMKAAVEQATAGCDALVMAAAVGDYTPAAAAGQKIKKTGDGLSLELTPTDDILAGLSGGFIKVGFAAETENLLENARAKLAAKSLDAIVANDVAASGLGFGSGMNRVQIIRRDGPITEAGPAPKRAIAEKVMDVVVELLGGSQQ